MLGITWCYLWQETQNTQSLVADLNEEEMFLHTGRRLAAEAHTRQGVD